MKRGEEYKGISQHHAKELLKIHGYNEIKTVKNNSPINILLHQIRTNYVVYLLLVALIISFVVGKIATAYTIIGVIVIVITVGFVQEYKAERAIESLKRMITPSSTVLRDDKECDIPTREIVPGDVIILRTGDRIPADCVVLEEKDLRVDESMLSGESKEIKKIVAKNPSGIGILNMGNINRSSDKDHTEKTENMVFMGTFITSGKCVARVIHTGMNTKFGSIANMISKAEKELPLQTKVNKIVTQTVIWGTIFSVIAGIILLIRNAPLTYTLFVEVLVVVLALAVAAFPEGFPVVLITTLAYGAYRMAQKNAIINRMSIIETLGETTVICSDKTGTITSGAMTVRKIFMDNNTLEVSGTGYSGIGEISRGSNKIDINDNKYDNKSTINILLRAAVLCNDSRIERKGENQEYNVYGSPTEAALLILGAKVGIHQEDLTHSRIEEIPFSSERKLMSVLVAEKNPKSNKTIKTVYVKGAPEIVIRKCKHIIINGKKIILTKKEIDKIHKQVSSMTSNSYRVIALAYKDAKSDKVEHIEHDLILLGLVGMEDPPRPEIKEAILECQSAGIKVKMITGDNKDTAEAIAREIGLKGNTISGEEIDLLSDEELTKIVNKIAIFVRVRPEHKLRIVHALKSNGEIVTMTGDGVNDAPALKEAHIGVAMGINGTDVSREASDLILKDDHFSTIVDAIREGRTIFNNIQKFAVYQLSINIAQVMLILLSVLIGLPLPLVAIQILFMNILSDEVTAISLSFNTYSKDVMNQPPRIKSEIITRPLLIFMLVAGILMTIGAVGIFFFMINILHTELAVARTTVFVTMTLFAIINAFNFRSFRKLVMNRSVFVNKYLFYASILSIVSTLAIIYTPLNKTFELVHIGWNEWFSAILLAVLLIVIMDILKFFNNKYKIIDRH